MWTTMDPMNESRDRRFVTPRKSVWYVLPAVSSAFFMAGALAVGSTGILILNVLMLFLAFASLVRPTIVAWAYLMVGSLGHSFWFLYSLEHSWHGSPTLGQWVVVTVLGVLPTVSLWWNRPRAVPQKSLAALLRETAP